jgi:ElaB/YqjD/DUF883 family membrane-anchored ribosome-binding protein
VAVVIAYAIALHMDWEKPYWAAWTAFSIGLATRGEGVHKGLERLAGALVGAVGGFVLLAFFIQDRWLFITFLSLYGAVFTYLALGSKRNNYFWQQAGFFATVIAFDSAFQPLNAFEVGIERAQETGAGLVTYIVVALLLWPDNSRRDLEQTASRLVIGVRQLWGNCTVLMSGERGVPGAQGLRDQVRRLQAEFGRLLGAAETDSWEVAEVRSDWHAFQSHIAELNETLARWQSDLDELQVRNFERLAPGWRSFLAEIDRRLAWTERMIAGNTPTEPPAPIALEFDDHQLRSLSHFDRAGLTAQRDRLQHIESVTRALFESVCVIRGFECGAARVYEPRADASFHLPVGRFSLDRDHLDEALRVAASVWLMFLAIVYIPGVPAGLGALGIATRLALADSAMPSFSLTHLLGPVVAAMAGAFPFYILLMPQLSGFPELALAVSAVVFAIVYIFHEPRQALLRTIFAYLFFTLISVTNEQTYSFMHYATTVTMWLVILSVLAVAEYFPVSHQPDRVFLRLLNRFFRSCEFLLRLGRSPKPEYSLMQRWKARFHAYEAVTLPAKLAQWGRLLPPGALGASTPGQVQTFVNRLWGLSYRMQALLEARAAHQSTALVQELRPDIRAWRTGVESILRSLAVEPASAEYEDLQSRLRATLTRLETRIEEALDRTNGQSLSAEESESMYRLLSAHRGVSESLVQLTQQAAALDWERLREARF